MKKNKTLLFVSSLLLLCSCSGPNASVDAGFKIKLVDSDVKKETQAVANKAIEVITIETWKGADPENPGEPSSHDSITTTFESFTKDAAGRYAHGVGKETIGDTTNGSMIWSYTDEEDGGQFIQTEARYSQGSEKITRTRGIEYNPDSQTLLLEAVAYQRNTEIDHFLTDLTLCSTVEEGGYTNTEKKILQIVDDSCSKEITTESGNTIYTFKYRRFKTRYMSYIYEHEYTIDANNNLIRAVRKDTEQTAIRSGGGVTGWTETTLDTDFTLGTIPPFTEEIPLPTN